jgi:hypothetical protein
VTKLSAHPPPDDDVSFVDHLIRTGSGENALTEFLCGLLRDPEVRQRFIHEVLDLEVPVEVIASASVRSEPEDATERGVPDLEILSGEELFVLVENKLGAAFTDNQPHRYFESLCAWHARFPNGLACLVIQAPARRLAGLEVEARRLLGEHCGNVLAAEVVIRFIPWERSAEILGRIQSPRPVLAYLIRSFVTMLPRHIESVSRPMTKDDVMRLTDSANLEAAAALEDLLRDVRGHLKRKYRLKPSSDETDFGSQGFDVLSPEGGDGDALWVGISHRFGAHFRCSPLLVHLVGDDLGNIDRLREAGHIVVDGGDLQKLDWLDRPAIPVPLTPGLDPANHAAAVVREIEEIWRMARRPRP